MNFETNLWRDVGDKPTRDLVRSMAKGAVYLTSFGFAAGACFALAWAGGTEQTRSWQWVVFGSAVAFFIAVSVLAVFQLSRIITDRITKPDDGVPNKASHATSKPAPGAGSSAHEG